MAKSRPSSARSRRAPTPERHAELTEIASVCRHVPAHPPRTFREAIQSFWFVHFALFSTHTQLSCGRLDQYLFPFLEADLQAGRLSVAQAQELVDCLWIRFNDRAQVERDNFVLTDRDNGGGTGARYGVAGTGKPRPWPAGHRKRFMLPDDTADAINHWGQNILLGGIRPDGTDGTNALTYLCLNAHEKLSYTSPVVTARLHALSPPELVRRVAEVLKEDGSGMPYIDNDDVLIQAYADMGVPIEDARDYANSNCWETLIQGKADQEIIRGINFPLLLELALNRGRSLVHGQMGPDTGDPLGFATFGELVDAWKSQLDHLVKAGIDYIGEAISNGTLEHSGHGQYRHYPLLSSLTLDCIEREKDATKGGARYTLWHVNAEGLANAVDALSAIKSAVYDARTLTMKELLAALEADWEGYESLRLTLANRYPKFANDDPYADAIGREMVDYFVERCHAHAERWHPQVLFPPSIGTFSWIHSIGHEVGATADGRHAHDPVAANLSPAPGADRSGPLAAINSGLKMRVGDLPAGAPMDLRLSKNAFRGEAGTDRLAGLIKAFIAHGGNMLVLTVTDVEDLKRAMEAPEEYAHLRVRMGGWSAYFCMLSKAQQELHIRRVEHGIG